MVMTVPSVHEDMHQGTGQHKEIGQNRCDVDQMLLQQKVTSDSAKGD
jgi:hypothetical protein